MGEGGVEGIARVRASESESENLGSGREGGGRG